MDLLVVHDVKPDLAIQSVQRGHVGYVFFPAVSVSDQPVRQHWVILCLCDMKELALLVLCGQIQKLKTKLKEKTAATAQQMCQI